MKRTHGKSRTSAYRLWMSIKQRCTNPKNSGWLRYGGRGIKMHPAWRDSFEAFYRDVGDPPPGKTIDRKNNNGNYEPGNIRFVTRLTQNNNRRSNHFLTFNGQSKTIAQWATSLGLDRTTIRRRIVLNGWTVEQALTVPVNANLRRYP